MTDAARALRAMPPARVLLVAMVVIIVYGSLFPFDFQPAHTTVAEMFGQWDPFIDRADAVDNVLLFVPLGVALRFGFARRSARWLASALAWLVLGLGLQLAQLFVPGRVASIADAINNAIGLAAGLAMGRLIEPWLARRRLLNPDWDAFALLLVGAWYVYESFPFLPTLDVGLLRGHLKTVLEADFDALRFARHTVAATLGTMLLLQAELVASRRAALASAAGVMLLSELLVPYGGLHASTLLGIVAGIASGERLDRWSGGQSRRVVVALALAALALTVATPFRGQASMVIFTFTPFSGLFWYGTTSGIPPTAFEALAIGALLWSGLPRGTKANASVTHWPWVVLVILAVAEVLRMQVFGFRGDTTTFAIWVVLAPFAAWAGGPRLATPAAIAPPAPPPDLVPPPVHEQTPSGLGLAKTGPSKRVALHVAAAWLFLTTGMWLVLRLPTIPYNVKELFDPDKRWAIALFAIVLLWLGFAPWWAATAAAARRAGTVWLPVLLFAASMFSLGLLTLSVTQESLDDIVGSPDLYRRITQDDVWGAQWRAWVAPWPAAPLQALERALRYAALYSVLMVPLSVAAMHLCGHWRRSRMLAGIVATAVMWWLAKAVVVDWAITDNLTELIAEGGVPFLAALLLLLAANVATVVGTTGRRGAAGAVAITVLFVPTTWWLLGQGLEPLLMKYGQVFSAQQFLLGQNRSARLDEWQLFARWTALYLASVFVIAWGMRLARGVMPPALR